MHVGDEYSRIDIFHEGNLVLTREIKAGVSSMAESLAEAVAEEQTRPVAGSEQLTVLAVDQLAHTLGTERAREVLLHTLTGSAPPEDKAFGLAGMGEEEIFGMIYPAAERLVRQVERTFDYFSGTLGNKPVNRIYLSGPIRGWSRFGAYVREQLGIEAEPLDALASGIPYAADVEPPVSFSERAGYALALGLALSDDSRTPNLLFPYQEKEERRRTAGISRAIFITFLAVVSVLVGTFIWQGRLVERKSIELARLRQQLAQYHPILDQTLMVQMASRVKEKRQTFRKEISERMGLAAIGELTLLTPSHIRLIGLRADLGAVAAAEGAGLSRSLLVEGIVQGESESLNASLADYLMKLEGSPLFNNPSVQSSGVEHYQDLGDALRFTIRLNLG